MSLFDRYRDAQNDTLFGFFGDPLVIQRGANEATTTGIYSCETVTDAETGYATVVHEIRYPRSAWNPRRGDSLTIRGKTFTVDAIADGNTEKNITVLVSPNGQAQP